MPRGGVNEPENFQNGKEFENDSTKREHSYLRNPSSAAFSCKWIKVYLL